MPAYPVEELGGLIFAYLGPQPAPLLPRWELFVRDGVLRDIGAGGDPLQLAADHGELPRPGARRMAASAFF